MPTKILDLTIVQNGGAMLYHLLLEGNSDVRSSLIAVRGKNKLSGKISVPDSGDGGPDEHYLAYEFRGPKGAEISMYGTYEDVNGNIKVIISEKVIPLNEDPTPPKSGIGAAVVFFSI